MRNKTMGYAVALAIGLFAFAIAGYLLVDMIINAHAEEVSLGATVRWNCENMKNVDHPMPVNFWTDGEGNWEVFLEDFTRMYGTRLDGGFMKWVWQDAWWHTNGVDVVYCESDVKALSILMAK